MKTPILIKIFLLICFCVINNFAQQEKKSKYALLLDNTGSMRSHLESVIDIGKEVVKETGEKDSLIIFSFESGISKAKISLNQEQDKNKLSESLDNLYMVEGKTPLYEAILLMSETLKSKNEKEEVEKILILVTDGDERINDIKQEEVIKTLKENKIKVLVIGLTSQLSLTTRASMQTKAESFLTNLAKETNGLVIFPKENKKAELIVKNLLTKNN